MNAAAKSGNQTVLSDDVTPNESNSVEWKVKLSSAFYSSHSISTSHSLFCCLPA